MINATKYNRLLKITTLSIVALAGVTPSAYAWKAYPRGWNVEANVPKPTYDFVPGQWGDSKRYEPGQTSPGNNPSHAMNCPTVIYGFTPGSGHYHEIR